MISQFLDIFLVGCFSFGENMVQQVRQHHPGPQALDWTARQKRIDQIAAAGKQVENKMFDTKKKGVAKKVLIYIDLDTCICFRRW